MVTLLIDSQPTEMAEADAIKAIRKAARDQRKRDLCLAALADLAHTRADAALGRIYSHIMSCDGQLPPHHTVVSQTSQYHGSRLGERVVVDTADGRATQALHSHCVADRLVESTAGYVVAVRMVDEDGPRWHTPGIACDGPDYTAIQWAPVPDHLGAILDAREPI